MSDDQTPTPDTADDVTVVTTDLPEVDLRALVKALIDQVDGDVIVFSGHEWAVDADEPDPAVMLLEQWRNRPGEQSARYAVRVTATVTRLP